MAEIEQSNPQERRRWQVVHWTGIAVMHAVLVAALAGLVGKGPLSKQKVRSADGRLEVEHQRFVRHHAPTELRINVGREMTSRGEIHLRLSKPFVESTDVENIVPTPVRIEAGPKFTTYELKVETNAAAEVRLKFQPARFGTLGYVLGVGDEASVDMKYFAYP